jgi:hypothetical protein
VPLEVARVPIVVVSVLMNTASDAEAARVCGGRESVVELAKLLQASNTGYRVFISVVDTETNPDRDRVGSASICRIRIWIGIGRHAYLDLTDPDWNQCQACEKQSCGSMTF